MSDEIDDVRYLRQVVEKTKSPAGVNRYWSVTLAWGVIIALGYATCALLGASGRTNVIPWVMPVAIFLIAMPLSWYLSRRSQVEAEDSGRRPSFRRDLMFLWLSITVMGLLGTAWLIASGTVAGQWYLISFTWCSLFFVGYMMNGVLLSREWFWAAGTLLGVLATACIGTEFYWLTAVGIPGTLVLAGLMGYVNARRQAAHA